MSGTYGREGVQQPLLQPADSIAIDIPEKKIRSITFKVGGIKCASCAASIETALLQLDGVENATVSPLHGHTRVQYVPDITNAKKVMEAVEDAGFSVSECAAQNIAVCRIRIKGMTCTSCSQSIESALKLVDGVKKAVVGLAIAEAIVHFDPDITDSGSIAEAIEAAGFEAELVISEIDVNRTCLQLEGLNSLEDGSIIQSSVESVEGVNHVEMDATKTRVTITYDADLTGPRSLIHHIQEVGDKTKSFKASLYIPPNGRELEQKRESRLFRTQFFLSCLLSVPVFMFSMVLPMLPPYGNWLDHKICKKLTLGMVARLIFCTPVQFIIGRRFYLGAYHALKRRTANMDVLVALGTNAAYFYSVYVVIKAMTSDIFEGHDFFETSAMLTSFILLGKYLEVIAKGKTTDALAKLIDLTPDTAHLLTQDVHGNLISQLDISTPLIQRNDILRIFPGEKVPVDGVVTSGESNVNESMITGEARSIPKRPGDKVIGGTVNQDGCLMVKATRVGTDTALSQIVQLVEAAQLARAPVQRLADKISRIFVPIVVGLAFITWLGWFIHGLTGTGAKNLLPNGMSGSELALQFCISVLVVACPCALGLATPTAIMVATGKGASLGILIKGGNSMEMAHKVKTVVFDKTGTLTMGKPVVADSKLFSTFSMENLYDIVIAVEANSEHPIAKAVVEHAKMLRQRLGTLSEHATEVQDFEVHVGTGVSAKVGAKTVLVGNKRLMKSGNVLVGPEVDNYISEQEKLARTCVLIAVEGAVVGAFAVVDMVRPEARIVVPFLQSMGISSAMVTGDNWATANAVAKEVGIDNVFAETDPLGKAQIIKDLQMKGINVAMVGDGINDSPALVAADVGMAIGAGTDVAIEAADIVLIKSNLEDVVTAVSLSRETMSRIWLNYIWAFGYNLISVPIAAGVLYPILGLRMPPWLAGACMALSSLSVVCSSLLLKTYQKPLQRKTNKNCKCRCCLSKANIIFADAGAPPVIVGLSN